LAQGLKEETMAKRKPKPKPKPTTPTSPPTSPIPEAEKEILHDIYKTFRKMYGKGKKGKPPTGS
jgi:hypothetical protein